MGEISCDLLTGERIFCAFIRYCDTTNEKITKIKPPRSSHDNFNQIVTHVVFYRGILPTFPSELGEIFPNLSYLDFYDCQMEKITKDDLKNFPKLEKLKVEANKLKFLPNDLFEFTPKISLLNFADNQIRKIGENLLDKLENLEEANFYGNLKINFKFDHKVNELEMLKKIIKNDCKLIPDLKDLSVDVLMSSIEKQNTEEVKLVAKVMKIEKLLLKIAEGKKISRHEFIKN